MNVIKRIYCFYKDGFASMTVGRSLWILILFKVVILFFVLKLFFFPNILKEKSNERGDNPAEIVTTEIMNRSTNKF